MRTGLDRTLKDLVDEEVAMEIAQKHIPNNFKWERNSEEEAYIMQWVIQAMIEFKTLN